MDPTLEQMADALVESGDYRVTRRLQPRTEYQPADDNPKFIAAVVDVETTGTDPEHDEIIDLESACSSTVETTGGSIGWSARGGGRRNQSMRRTS
jgi:DNA polymerase-3 subunit epsilon